MGHFYANITVKGAAPDALVAFLSAMQVNAHIALFADQYAVACDDLGDEDLAHKISDHFSCTALFVSNHDDDVLQYRLFQFGSLVDSYDSNATYCGSSALSSRGNPTILCKTFGASESTQQVAQTLREPHLVEVERHFALAKLLHLPLLAVGTGYNDIEHGEVHEWPSCEYSLVRTPLENQSGSFQVGVLATNEETTAEAASFLASPDSLNVLTLRAVLALAARAAHRIRHHYPLETSIRSKQKVLCLVDSAIHVAADFAIGAPLDQNFLKKVMYAIEHIRELGNEFQFDSRIRVYHAPHAHDMVVSALNAAQAALDGTWAELLREQPEFTLSITSSVRAAFYATRYGIGGHQDFATLLQIGRGNPSQLGDPIDPSEHGPLGSI